MDNIEKIVLDKIEGMRDEIIKFHQEIIKIPSENPPRKYKEIAKFTEKKFKELGLITQVKRNNVVGELRNGGGRSLIFYGHLDTVEAFKEQWTKNPFGGEIINGKLYGRGASDDKSCVTAEIYATKALLDAGIKLNGNLILTAVIDEETGGLRGADYLLEKGIIKGDACLLGDAPSDYPFGYTGGSMYITFTTYGKQAHGLGFPDLPAPYRSEHSGINAVEKMIMVMNFLLELKEEFLTIETKYPLLEGWAPVSNVNMAEIHGGTKITTVPFKCFLHVSICTIPEQDIGSIKTRILNYVEELKKQDPHLEITVQIPIFFEPQIINENSDFAMAVKQATKTVFNEEREFKLFLPSTDAHWFQERNIPTILIGASRGDTNPHAEDEFVYIEDLINTTKMFAMTALNYLK
jgi:succinyl-diaminopimelate desuccinylase